MTRSTPETQALQARIAHCLRRDQHRFRQRLKQAGNDAPRLAELATKIEASVARRQARADKLPAPGYPEELPVSQRREEIAAAIREHQVVIVAGETGSGKTTQLPKICLELGRGVAGLIGHTQPRRLAARSVATRIAEELGSPLGEAVGYKVRFSDHTRASSYIKLMTDGILLAELQGDRFLDEYDTLIIDEAHERSLNIDFLLGYLKQLLPRRPDLKLI
ncbi:MAG TPA: ATP-dependent RNA helicase HrpA, partial [Gammaproteobacteria bacterium]|nr:ATP-dependent RNA helicase HrpA [Gammaproteobacteria bacterium]